MSDILGQIGTRIGQEFNLVSDRFQGLKGDSTYSEVSYDTDGNVSSVETWEDDSKQSHIKTKTFNYSSGILTEILVANNQSITVFKQTLSYDTNGNLVSVDKEFINEKLGSVSIGLSISVLADSAPAYGFGTEYHIRQTEGVNYDTVTWNQVTNRWEGNYLYIRGTSGNPMAWQIRKFSDGSVLRQSNTFSQDAKIAPTEAVFGTPWTVNASSSESQYSEGDVVTWANPSNGLSYTAHLESYNGSGSWVIKYDCVNYPNDCYTENNAQESDFS